jgi:hypothetical protein
MVPYQHGMPIGSVRLSLGPTCKVARKGRKLTIEFTAIRLTGGQRHEHISHLWWTNPTTQNKGDNTRAQLVTWVEEGGKGYVDDQSGHRAYVEVRDDRPGPKYLQTKADGVWCDNLLALPEKT